ncbi:hypothetical protein ACQEU3_39110 [Spirillospora sp. CA-253888]
MTFPTWWPVRDRDDVPGHEPCWAAPGYPDVPASVRTLAGTLVMLAATAEEQDAWCERHHWCEDELALDFDWALGWVPWTVEERSPGLLPEPLLLVLKEMDERLTAMSGPLPEGVDRWLLVPGWDDVRELAAEAVRMIADLGLIAVPKVAEL